MGRIYGAQTIWGEFLISNAPRGSLEKKFGRTTRLEVMLPGILEQLAYSSDASFFGPQPIFAEPHYLLNLSVPVFYWKWTIMYK